MMKNLFLLACLFYIQSSLAVAPYGIKGQAQAQTLYSNVHQFPNQNVTNIGGINALVYDSGLIFDGGFESATAFQGHTIVSGATYFSVVTAASDVLDGKKTARVTCFNAAPSGVCKIEQTVNLGTHRLNGFPMLLSVRVESSPDQPLTFCAKIDGVEKDCVTGYKGYLTIPTQVGSTSVGYTLSKNEYVSPLTSLFDSIKVEITETVTNAPVVGPRVQYTPTFTGFGAVTNVNFTYQQIGSNVLIEGNFTAGTSTGVEARISLPSGLTSPTGLPTVSIRGNLEAALIGSGGQNVGSSYSVMIEPNISYVTFSARSSGNTGLSKLAGSSVASGVNLSMFAIIPIAQYQASVPTYSDRCRDPRNCETVFSTKVSATGVVSGENLDFINGNCNNPGTGLFNCPFNTSLFSLAPNCFVTGSYSATLDGNLTIDTTTTTNSGNIRGYQSNSLAPISFNLICQRQGQDYINAKVNQIVGSFKDYVKTPNTATGKVGFCSAKISATGVISDQLGGCFASCTNATTPVCTFTSNYWRSGSMPNCTHGDGGDGWTVCTGTTSSSSFSGGICNGSLATVTGRRVYQCHGEIQ